MPYACVITGDEYIYWSGCVRLFIKWFPGRLMWRHKKSSIDLNLYINTNT